VFDENHKNVTPMHVAGIQLTIKYQKAAGTAAKTLKDFKSFLSSSDDFKGEIKTLGDQVKKFSHQFEMPGFENF
jgi:hypothetical protein